MLQLGGGHKYDSNSQIVLQLKRWQLWWRTKWLEIVFQWVWWTMKKEIRQIHCFWFSTYTFSPLENVCCASVKPNAISAPLGRPLLVTVGTATSSKLNPLVVCDERMQTSSRGRNGALLCTMTANVIICGVGDAISWRVLSLAVCRLPLIVCTRIVPWDRHYTNCVLVT